MTLSHSKQGTQTLAGSASLSPTKAKMRNDWRKAEVSDLNTLKMIDGKVYKGVAEAMLVNGEYETQVRWHRANWREVSRYMKAVR